MITHVVMWHLKDEALGADRAANATQLKTKLEAMAGEIPGMHSLEVGLDKRRRANSADIVLIARFTDDAALEAFHTHPAHALVQPFAAAVRSESVVVDYGP